MSEESGLLFLVTAPSGAGKTSLVRAWSEKDTNVRISISHTTRASRPGEKEGVHYHFIDEQAFLSRIEADYFIEYAKVYQHYYGTAKSEVEALLAEGRDVILEIDWQGAQQVKAWKRDAIWVLVAPPNIEALEARLHKRGQDSEEVIQSRMSQVAGELEHYQQSDYVVINEHFNEALDAMMSIAVAERHRTRLGQSQKRMEKLLSLR